MHPSVWLLLPALGLGWLVLRATLLVLENKVRQYRIDIGPNEPLNAAKGHWQTEFRKPSNYSPEGQRRLRTIKRLWVLQFVIMLAAVACLVFGTA